MFYGAIFRVSSKTLKQTDKTYQIKMCSSESWVQGCNRDNQRTFGGKRLSRRVDRPGMGGVRTLKAPDGQIEPSERRDEEDSERRRQEFPASAAHPQHSLGWGKKNQKYKRNRKRKRERPKVTSMWAAGLACADSWHWNRTRCGRTR